MTPEDAGTVYIKADLEDNATIKLPDATKETEGLNYKFVMEGTPVGTANISLPNSSQTDIEGVATIERGGVADIVGINNKTVVAPNGTKKYIR